jgi:esterase/lipase
LQARSCPYAKNQLLAHHFGKKKIFLLAVPVTKMRKSSILNKYFCSVTHLENENKNLPDFDERGSETLGNLIVFEQDVVYIISTLNPNKGL